MRFCREFRLADIPHIVLIHQRAFPGFFLTALGPKYLAAMYESFMKRKSGITLVYENEDGIRGFAAGHTSDKSRDRMDFIKSIPGLFLALLPSLLLRPQLLIRRAVPSRAEDRSSFIEPIGSAWLKSIGVAPGDKGKGVADHIISEFEAIARKRNAHVVLLTTDALNNDRAIGFYLKHGYRQIGNYTQARYRKMLIMGKMLNNQSEVEIL